MDIPNLLVYRFGDGNIVIDGRGGALAGQYFGPKERFSLRQDWAVDPANTAILWQPKTYRVALVENPADGDYEAWRSVFLEGFGPEAVDLSFLLFSPSGQKGPVGGDRAVAFGFERSDLTELRLFADDWKLNESLWLPPVAPLLHWLAVRKRGQTGPTLVFDFAKGNTLLFVLEGGVVQAAHTLPVGMDVFAEAIRGALRLRLSGSALRLLFNGGYDFGPVSKTVAESVADTLGRCVEETVPSLTMVGCPAVFLGLPPGASKVARCLAAAMHLRLMQTAEDFAMKNLTLTSGRVLESPGLAPPLWAFPVASEQPRPWLEAGLATALHFDKIGEIALEAARLDRSEINAFTEDALNSEEREPEPRWKEPATFKRTLPKPGRIVPDEPLPEAPRTRGLALVEPATDGPPTWESVIKEFGLEATVPATCVPPPPPAGRDRRPKLPPPPKSKRAQRKPWRKAATRPNAVAPTSAPTPQERPRKRKHLGPAVFAVVAAVALGTVGVSKSGSDGWATLVAAGKSVFERSVGTASETSAESELPDRSGDGHLVLGSDGRRNQDGELTAGSASSGGTLKIVSEPLGAEAWLDGVLVGETPVTVRDLDFGTHSVRVVKPDYATFEATSTLEEANRDLAMLAPLERLQGTLAIETEPAGIAVTVKSREPGSEVVFSGPTPLVIDEIPVGRYEVQISRPGWADQTTELVVREDVPATLRHVFPEGNLVLTSEPAGATVLGRDLQVMGKTPLEISALRASTHHFELVGEGLETFDLAVDVIPQETTRRHVELIDLRTILPSSVLDELPSLEDPEKENGLLSDRSARSSAYIATALVTLDSAGRPIEVVPEGIERRSLSKKIVRWAEKLRFTAPHRRGVAVKTQIRVAVVVYSGSSGRVDASHMRNGLHLVSPVAG